MSELISSHRKDALKAILRRLHAGEPLPALKEEFRQAVGDITPSKSPKSRASSSPRESALKKSANCAICI